MSAEATVSEFWFYILLVPWNGFLFTIAFGVDYYQFGKGLAANRMAAALIAVGVIGTLATGVALLITRQPAR